MTVIKEDGLIFSFPNEWTAVKYDESTFYDGQVRHCGDTKAVDILAISCPYLYMIEIKDYRNHRIEGKTKIADLPQVVAKKVRDTCVGLYGAQRKSENNLREFYTFLFNSNPPPLRVILHIEEDRPRSGPKSLKSIRSALLTKIKQRLRFLEVQCNVHNRTDLAAPYGWTVR